ncbi:MAG: flagellar M-ring protein FliF [Desulfuromonadales bacterium C00003094]|jgi:flagellar M-ring protein FliF|nr:MAG: flagellar M-ring protein FliF [Desulfuromonadales bacterium C00003094]
MAEETKPNLIETIKLWPKSRQVSLGVVTVLCLVFFSVLVMQARHVDYQLLFGNLPAGDAAAVLTRLKEQKIAYRLESGGTAIYIPANKVYEIRLELAGAGLPQGAGVGFEIFDKQSFGMTDFAQKINYQRALQGELSRTISSLAPVEGARVHLAMAAKRLFREQQEKTTASVIVKMVPGRKLNDGQIQGIVNLVSGSVEGLHAGQVSIIDANGRVLSKSPQADMNSPLSPGLQQYQQSLEKRLENRAQSLLDRALGVGNSLVQITASLDFSQREHLEEAYDPNGSAVRSEQATTEKSGNSTNGGVPGVESNINESSGSQGFNSSNRSDETTNYEVSKTVSKIVESVGSIKTLSVAVLVADRQLPAGEANEATYEPRPAEELTSIEQMVRSALGISDERGDQIVVLSRPFENDFYDTTAPEATPGADIYSYLPMVKYGLLTIAALLLYFLLVRPLVKTLKGEGKMVEHYKTVEQLESELSGKPLQLEGPNAEAAKIREQVLNSENVSAQIIKTWLKEG